MSQILSSESERDRVNRKVPKREPKPGAFIPSDEDRVLLLSRNPNAKLLLVFILPSFEIGAESLVQATGKMLSTA